MKKILFVLFTSISFGVKAQGTFIKTFSDGAPFWYQPFIKTIDGNLLTASYWNNFYITKTDMSGNIYWTKEFVIQGGGVINSIIQTVDLGYILAGSLDSLSIPISDNKPFLLKVDSSGLFSWIKIYNATGNVSVNGVFQTNDSGYLVSAGNGIEANIIRTDKNGDTLWTKILSGTGSIWSSYCTNDNGFILCGNGSAGGINLIKIDSLANVTWSNNYVSGALEFGRTVLQTSDSGYIVTGCNNCLTPNDDGLVFKTEKNGSLIWAKKFISPLRDFGMSVIENSINEFVLTGYLNDTAGFGTFLINLNTNGDTNWTSTYPVNGGGVSLIQSDNGGYIISCQQSNPNQTVIIRTNAIGETGCSQKYNSLIIQDVIPQITNLTVQTLSSNVIVDTIQVQQHNINLNTTTICINTGANIESKKLNSNFSFSPNPFHSTATIRSNSQFTMHDAQLKIYNAMGSLVRIEHISNITPDNNQDYILHRDYLSNGLYFYELRSNNYELLGRGKFVIE
ncbi:MAG: hypothetical protein ABI763_10495 [Bacteroidota bacterium]